MTNIFMDNAAEIVGESGPCASSRVVPLSDEPAYVIKKSISTLFFMTK